MDLRNRVSRALASMVDAVVCHVTGHLPPVPVAKTRLAVICELITDARAERAKQGLPPFGYLALLPSDWEAVFHDASHFCLFRTDPGARGGWWLLGLPMVRAYSAEDREREARGEIPLVIVP